MRATAIHLSAVLKSDFAFDASKNVEVAVVLRRGDRTPEQPPPVFVEERLRAGAVGGGAGRARQDRRERRADQRGRHRLRGVHVVRRPAARRPAPTRRCRSRGTRSALAGSVAVHCPFTSGKMSLSVLSSSALVNRRRNGRPDAGPEHSSWKFGLPEPAVPVLPARAAAGGARATPGVAAARRARVAPLPAVPGGARRPRRVPRARRPRSQPGAGTRTKPARSARVITSAPPAERPSDPGR